MVDKPIGKRRDAGEETMNYYGQRCIYPNGPPICQEGYCESCNIKIKEFGYVQSDQKVVRPWVRHPTKDHGQGHFIYVMICQEDSGMLWE